MVAISVPVRYNGIMFTSYQLPCSCGCGVILTRNIFATGACKIRAYRDRQKQTKLVGNTPPQAENHPGLIVTFCQIRNFGYGFCRKEGTQFFHTPKFFIGNDEVFYSGILCDKHYQQVSVAKWGD